MQSIPNPNDASENLVAISPLALEIFMFESVDRQMDAREHARTPARLVYYQLTL